MSMRGIFLLSTELLARVFYNSYSLLHMSFKTENPLNVFLQARRNMHLPLATGMYCWIKTIQS